MFVFPTTAGVRRVLSALIPVLVVVALLPSPRPAAQAGYALETLPSPASDVTDSGNVVGAWAGPGGSLAYVWTQATGAQPLITDSAIIARFPCTPPKINASGVVVGRASHGASCGQAPFRAARYSSALGLEVGSETEGDNGQSATAVNSAGDATGNYRGGSPIPFMWPVGSALFPLVPFAPPVGDAIGVANDINDTNVIVGWCQGDSVSTCVTNAAVGSYAYWWANNQRNLLPKVAGRSGANHEALALNNNGLVVGRYSAAGGVAGAFLSSIAGSPTTTVDLLAPAGSITAMDINDAGDVVATITPPTGGSVPYLYRNGVWTDINTLRPPGSTLQLQTATAINNVGWIVGGAGPTAASLGYVLIPPPPNSAPTASPLSKTTPEDTAVSDTLSATDPNGDLLSYTIVTNALHGTAVVTNATNGAFTYTPNANYSGPDAFTFKASDGTFDSNEATVTLDVKAVNDAPEALDSVFPAVEDTPTSTSFQATDVDGPALTFTIVTNGSKGTAVITDATIGAFTYTPNLDATGPDSVTFRVSDGAFSDDGTFTLDIGAVNDAPVASNGTLAVTEDIDASGTLAASDVDSASVTFSIVNNGSKGTASITNAATGAYTYTPNANANGADSVTFQVSDGSLTSNVATVSVSIAAVNDAPVASPGTLAVTEDVQATGSFVASDVDGPSLTYSIVTNGVKGTAVITNPTTGAFTYTPRRNAAGADSVAFAVSDGALNSNVAAIAVTIAGVNDAPVAYGQSPFVLEDTPTAIRIEGADPEGDALTFAVTTMPAHGTLSGVPPNLTYTPNPNYNGSDTFAFRVDDASSNSAAATISLIVSPEFWSPLGPDGGDVLALAVDPITPSVLYAATNGGGVFRSTDGGATWAPRSAGLTNFIVSAAAINPATPTTLYVATNGAGVFRSVDGGATWTPRSSGILNLIILAMALDPLAPDTLYASTSGAGMFKSTDAGATWSPANTGISGSARTIAVDPVTPGTLYVGTNSGVFRSTNGGASWAARSVGLTSLNVAALVVDPTAPLTLYAATFSGGVFKSIDGGGVWSPRNSGLTNLSLQTIAIDPFASSTLYAGSTSGLFRSADAGATWAPRNSGGVTGVGSVAFDRVTPSTLYVASGGVFKSTDGSTTWALLSAGLSSPAVYGVAVDPTAPTTLVVGTGTGLLRTTNGGLDWNRQHFACCSASIVIDPATPSRMYAGTSGAGPLRSTDGGITWLPSTGISGVSVTALAIDPGVPARLYAATVGGAGVYRSTDAGITWSSHNSGLTNPNVFALAMDPAAPTTLYAGTTNGWYSGRQTVVQLGSRRLLAFRPLRSNHSRSIP